MTFNPIPFLQEASVSTLLQRLVVNRLRVINRSISFDEEMDIYSSIITSLIDWTVESVTHSNVVEGLWSLVVTVVLILHAADHFGVQCALGAVFFACADLRSLDGNGNGDEVLQQLAAGFLKNNGQAMSLLDMAITLTPDVDHMLTTMYYGTSLEANLTAINGLIESRLSYSDLFESCLNISSAERTNRANFWQVTQSLNSFRKQHST
jgi:hypothetical protein